MYRLWIEFYRKHFDASHCTRADTSSDFDCSVEPYNCSLDCVLAAQVLPWLEATRWRRGFCVYSDRRESARRLSDGNPGQCYPELKASGTTSGQQRTVATKAMHKQLVANQVQFWLPPTFEGMKFTSAEGGAEAGDGSPPESPAPEIFILLGPNEPLAAFLTRGHPGDIVDFVKRKRALDVRDAAASWYRKMLADQLKWVASPSAHGPDHPSSGLRRLIRHREQQMAASHCSDEQRALATISYRAETTHIFFTDVSPRISEQSAGE
ncbi:hypothetical protein Esti_002962 [Eimeria stiedai]